MSVHAELGSSDPGNLAPGQTAYLDWFMENTSPFPTEDTFETHVYVDGIFVQAWTSTQSPPFQVFGVRNWPDLTNTVRIDRGAHTFRLVVDALDEVPETDETDNTFEWTFTWGGQPLPPQETGGRAVNLVLQPVTDRSEPVVTAAVAGTSRSGPLTVEGKTFISWRAGNAGLASTDADVAVHVYFDGILVDGRTVRGFSALSGSGLPDWDGLTGAVRVKPGEHTLTVSVDPGNLVAESDETDNAVTSVLTWGTGPAVAPPPDPEPSPVPAPTYVELTKPNLASYLPGDWDAPLVVRSAGTGTSMEGRSGRVSAFESAIAEFSFTNDSPVRTGSSITTRVTLDGTLVDETVFATGVAGSRWTSLVSLPAASLTPGKHTLTVEIDPAGEIGEADEADNTLSAEFEAVSGPPPAPEPPVVYTTSELEAMLAAVPAITLESADADADPAAGWPEVIISVADAAYFLVTGTALADERIDIKLLPRAAYEEENLAICLQEQATLTAAERAVELAECRDTVADSIGLTHSGRGVVRVSVDSSGRPARVVTTLLHELGHARQALKATPSTNSGSNFAFRAVQEAQAQVFEAVGWRHIEEFLGARFTQFPALDVLDGDVNFALDRQLEKSAEQEEHGLGYELMWRAALQDPAGLGLAGELRANGELGAASALAFYDYLLTVDAAEAPAWVIARLAGPDSLVTEFRAISLARLVEGLATDSEGHPDLLDPAFLAP